MGVYFCRKWWSLLEVEHVGDRVAVRDVLVYDLENVIIFPLRLYPMILC